MELYCTNPGVHLKYTQHWKSCRNLCWAGGWQPGFSCCAALNAAFTQWSMPSPCSWQSVQWPSKLYRHTVYTLGVGAGCCFYGTQCTELYNICNLRSTAKLVQIISESCNSLKTKVYQNYHHLKKKMTVYYIYLDFSYCYVVCIFLPAHSVVALHSDYIQFTSCYHYNDILPTLSASPCAEKQKNTSMSLLWNLQLSWIWLLFFFFLFWGGWVGSFVQVSSFCEGSLWTFRIVACRSIHITWNLF